LQDQNLSVPVAIVENLKDAPPEVLLVALVLAGKGKVASARFRELRRPRRRRSNGGMACDISVLDFISQFGELSNVLSWRSFPQKLQDYITRARTPLTFVNE
jgi:hypothetical protein